MKKLLVLNWILLAVTPVMASNADNFRDHDPLGWMMAVISMSVVFCALLVLFLCFKYGYDGIVALCLKLKKLFHRQKQMEAITDKRSKRQAAIKVTDAKTGNDVSDDEVAAAIGIALFLHADGMHDAESDVLTLSPMCSSWTGAGQNQKKSPMRKF